jgi:hypothetical protein
MVTEPLDFFVPSVTEDAVIVTVPPVGTVDGAVKVVGAPLAVVVVESDPQFDEPQANDQLTPALVESLLTVAVNGCEVLSAIEAGEVPMATEMVAGGVVVLLDPPPQAASVASVPRAIALRIS